jgi:anhydro-N-acetylmuramic acid kinase
MSLITGIIPTFSTQISSGKMKEEKYKVIGLMSGSSLDGLDLAYCEFTLQNNLWAFVVKSQETIKFPAKIHHLLTHNEIYDLNTIDIEFGKFTAEAVLKFIQKYQVHPDLIGSHGHTLIHEPENGFTFQAGNGQIIARETGIKTVYDFRTEDVEKGGQGAPLVPVGDKLLFSEYSHCLNLGGFSNISFDHKSQRIAFDICPVNTILNYYVKSFNLEYDRDGTIGKTGKIIDQLLKELNSNTFYKKLPPKSLGKAFVDNEIIKTISKYKIDSSDILRTLYEHIGIQISTVLNTEGDKRVLCTGGGAKNTFLMERISKLSEAEIIIPDNVIIDFKEAIIFAFLAVLRIRDEINIYNSVTGASSNSSAGLIVNR